MSRQIIFIDDDDDLRAAQTQGLELAGFSVRAFAGGPEALKRLTPDFDGVVITDVRMPGMDGLEVLKRIKAVDIDIPVILMTGHGDVPMAVQALKSGAYDFITKPFAMDTLMASIRRAVDLRALVLENRRLRALNASAFEDDTQLLGNSPMMHHLRQTLSQVAEAEVDILIQGDTGVGKELVARTIHRQSSRKRQPFVQVNCAVVPDAIFAGELFGIESGSRLEAHGPLSRRTVGRIEKAQKGTLFLDDIEGLSLPLQAKLLRVVEARELWTLGAEEPRAVDIRIIAASRTDLGDAVRAGTFRADLYYRLSGVTLKIPPLQARAEDAPLLFQHFLIRACARLKRPVPPLTHNVQTHLKHHDWPGNVRELEQFAERFALGLVVEPAGTSPTPAGVAHATETLSAQVNRFEAQILRDTLIQVGGNAKAAMESLQLPRKTFYDKLNRHDIDIGQFRKPSDTLR